VDDEGALSAPVSTTADIASDQNGDGTPEDLDNCILVANVDQRDSDNDGYGNICDADLNQDLQTDLSDFSWFRIVFDTADPDADFNESTGKIRPFAGHSTFLNINPENKS
jgi:hypothetical protein